MKKFIAFFTLLLSSFSLQSMETPSLDHKDAEWWNELDLNINDVTSNTLVQDSSFDFFNFDESTQSEIMSKEENIIEEHASTYKRKREDPDQ